MYFSQNSYNNVFMNINIGFSESRELSKHFLKLDVNILKAYLPEWLLNLFVSLFRRLKI